MAADDLDALAAAHPADPRGQGARVIIRRSRGGRHPDSRSARFALADQRIAVDCDSCRSLSRHRRPGPAGRVRRPWPWLRRRRRASSPLTTSCGCDRSWTFASRPTAAASPTSCRRRRLSPIRIRLEIFVVSAEGGPVARGSQPMRVCSLQPCPRRGCDGIPMARRVSFLAAAENRPQVFVGFRGWRTVRCVDRGTAGRDHLRVVARWQRSPTSPATLRRAQPVIRAGHGRSRDAAMGAVGGGAPAHVLTPPATTWTACRGRPRATRSCIRRPASPASLRRTTRVSIAVAADGTRSRVIVDRARHEHPAASCSPDGRSIAFVTTNEQPRSDGAARACRGRRRTDDDAGTIRPFSLGGAWIGEMLWARDSRSIFVLDERGHVCDRRAHVRDAGGPHSTGRRGCRAGRRRSDRQLFDQCHARRPHARVSCRRRSDDGRCLRAGRSLGRPHEAD